MKRKPLITNDNKKHQNTRSYFIILSFRMDLRCIFFFFFVWVLTFFLYVKQIFFKIKKVETVSSSGMIVQYLVYSRYSVYCISKSFYYFQSKQVQEEEEEEEEEDEEEEVVVVVVAVRWSQNQMNE